MRKTKNTFTIRYNKREYSDWMVTGIAQNYDYAIATSTSEERLTELLKEIEEKKFFNPRDRAFFRTEIEFRRRELSSLELHKI